MKFFPQIIFLLLLLCHCTEKSKLNPLGYEDSIGSQIIEQEKYVKKVKIGGKILREIDAKILNEKPYLRWNAYVDLLALEGYGELSDTQKIAHLAFWYDSEVQNGGHYQYFTNRGTKHLKESIKALEVLGAKKQAKILAEASKLLGNVNTSPKNKEEFISEALAGNFEKLDSRYGDCKPDIHKYLEKYLSANEAEFLKLR